MSSKKFQRPPLTNPLNDYVRQYCNNTSTTMTQLAKRANISRTTLNDLLQQESNPKVGHFVSLANAMRVHPQILLKLKWSDFDLQSLAYLDNPEFPARHEHDASGFVDETVPDNTVVPAGATFDKTWTIQNVGDITWENRSLVCTDLPPADNYPLPEKGEDYALIPHSYQVPIPTIYPQQRHTILVRFTAPKVAGRYMSYWKMMNDKGELCFPDGIGLTVSIIVQTLGVNYMVSQES